MKKQNVVKLAHNGDVQVMATALPKGARPIAHKPLALGEKSGHMHLATGDCELYEDPNETGSMYVVVGPKGARLQHVHESNFNGNYKTENLLAKADHKHADLTPNTTYKVGIHKRYNPVQKVWDKVQD